MLLVAGVITASRAISAQQKPTPVVGYLPSGRHSRSNSFMAAFLQALSDSGYVEGQNVAIEFRQGEGRYDRLPGLAADLVARKVDVIAAFSIPAALAAKNATSTIPIVFSIGADPVEFGLVANLARPGDNLTGVSALLVDLMPKRLDLLSETDSRAQSNCPAGKPEQSERRAGDPRRRESGTGEGVQARYPEGPQ